MSFMHLLEQYKIVLLLISFADNFKEFFQFFLIRDDAFLMIKINKIENLQYFSLFLKLVLGFPGQTK